MCELNVCYDRMDGVACTIYDAKANIQVLLVRDFFLEGALDFGLKGSVNITQRK